MKLIITTKEFRIVGNFELRRIRPVAKNDPSASLPGRDTSPTKQFLRRLLVAMVYCIPIGSGALNVAAADAPWPMYQGNARHTGYVPATLNTASFAARWSTVINSGAVLNPVTAAEGKVFVSESGGLHAVDAATGNILWNTNLGGVFSVNPPSYANGTVYIQTCNNYMGTYLHAFQATSGAEVFRSAHAAQWEHYLAPTIYAGNVYVDGGEYGGMYSFNATSGVQNWFGYVGQYDGWTPAVDTNYCYVFTGSGDTVPILGEFRVIDRFSGNTRYLITDRAFQWNGYTMNAAVTLGTHTNAFAINEPGSTYPTYGPYGRLLMFDLRADGTNTPHIGWVLTNHFTGQVTLANGVLYANDGGNLTALDERTGSTLWTWRPTVGTLSGTFIACDNVILAGTDTATYAVDIINHQPVWSNAVSGRLALGEGVLYIAGASGTLTAVTAPSTSPPVARTAVVKVIGNEVAQIPAYRFLIWCTDPDNYPLSLAGVTSPSAMGAIVTLATNQVSYAPPVGFLGDDTFGYTITNGHGGFASGTALIHVEPRRFAAATLFVPVTLPGALQVDFIGYADLAYTVERAESLDGPWKAIGSVITDANGAASFTERNPPARAAFYRATHY